MTISKRTSIALIGLLTVFFGSLENAAAEPRYVDRDKLFNVVRSKYHPLGKFTQKQVDSYNALVSYWESRPDLKDPRWLAYALATALHETRMQPVREGYCKTDSCSRNAVKKLWRKGRIKRNYAAEDPKTEKSYYGRGYVQLTHAYNYKDMGEELGIGDKLYREPDLALDPEIATKILWLGMIKGKYRGDRKGRRYKLSRFFNSRTDDWVNARDIINGDKKKLGKRIAGYGRFYMGSALHFVAAPTPTGPPDNLASVPIVGNDTPPPEVTPSPRPGPDVPAGEEDKVASVVPQPLPGPGIPAPECNTGVADLDSRNATLTKAADELRRLSEQLQSLVGDGPAPRLGDAPH